MQPGCLVRALKNEYFPCPGFNCQGIEERIWQHCLFGSQEGWRGLNTFLPRHFKEKRIALGAYAGSNLIQALLLTRSPAPWPLRQMVPRMFEPTFWRLARTEWQGDFMAGCLLRGPTIKFHPNIKNRLKRERIKIFAFNKRLVWRGWNSSSCRQRSVHFNGCFIFFLGEFLPKKHKFWNFSKMNWDIGLKLSRSDITFDSSQKMSWDEISPTNRSRDGGF